MNASITAAKQVSTTDAGLPLVIHTRVISGQGGGPEKTILNSPRFLEPLGYHGVCVYLRDPNDDGFEIIRRRAADKAAPLVEVDDFGIRDLGIVRRMGDAVERVLGGAGGGSAGGGSAGGGSAGGGSAGEGSAGGGSAGEGSAGGGSVGVAPPVLHSSTPALPHSSTPPLLHSSTPALPHSSTPPPFIWHGHDYKSNLIGLLLRRRFPNMRLVTTVHGWVQRTWKTPLYYAIDKWCLKRYEQVVCVSRDLWDDCRQLGVPETRLSLIDNAIALDDYEYEVSQAEAKRSLGMDADCPLIVAVGRLSDEKGFDLLIDAVAGLNATGGNVQLAIAGDGAFRESLQRRIETTGHADRIRLLGFVADPRLVYRAGDVYVLSSYREGLPNVVLEAMAMRLPVVSTKIAGMPDLVVDGDNGLMVPTGDASAIRNAIGRLLDDRELAVRLAAAGRATVEQRFSFTARMQRIAEVYRRGEWGSEGVKE